MVTEGTLNRIRIALAITELEVGGAERCLTQLAVGLDPRRFAATVYSLAERPPSERAAFVQQLEAAGIPVRFVGLRSKSPWEIRRGERELRRMLREQSPHVLQTFLFHANVLGSWAGRRAAVPHMALGLRVADRRRWRMVAERIASRFAARVVCVSDSVATFAREEVGIAADKLVVIPNGLDVAAYSAPAANLAELGVPVGRRVAVVIGRLHEQKGLDWLLAVAPRFLSVFDDVDLLIVGRGPAELALRAAANEGGIAERVHFTGWRPDISEILAASSLLILPSRWEGMPNVVLEAMASGRPVVATRVEGTAELLGAASDRQLVDFGNDEQLFEHVASVLRDTALANDLGRGNRDRATSEFSLRRMIERYETLYSSMAEAR